MEKSIEHIDLLWKYFIVLPPSKHKCGNKYEFYCQQNLPETLPQYVDLNNLYKYINFLCAHPKFFEFDYTNAVGNKFKLYFVDLVKNEELAYTRYDVYDKVDFLKQLRTPEAQNTLGVMYAMGIGVEANMDLSIYYFRKSTPARYTNFYFNDGKYRGLSGITSCPLVNFNIANLISCGLLQGDYNDVSNLISSSTGYPVEKFLPIPQQYVDTIYKNMALQYVSKSTVSLRLPFSKPNYFLFFDTETTGKPNNYNLSSKIVRNWPRLVQLSWILTDENGNYIDYDNSIVYPNDFSIPIEATKIHRITNEEAKFKGKPIDKIIKRFEDAFKSSSCVVGHNINFDKRIIGAELVRLGKEDFMDSKKSYCTMQLSTDFCKLVDLNGYKYPKLVELHQKLFGYNFDNIHDASADVNATCKCFWELVKRGVINL